MDRGTRVTPTTRALRVQGGYYLIGGRWPLLHFSSFERATGRKPDRFVTEAAASLYLVIGATMLSAARRDPALTERLGLLTAVATAAIDLRHRSAISKVYVAEAVWETMPALATTAARVTRRCQRA